MIGQQPAMQESCCASLAALTWFLLLWNQYCLLAAPEGTGLLWCCPPLTNGVLQQGPYFFWQWGGYLSQTRLFTDVARQRRDPSMPAAHNNWHPMVSQRTEQQPRGAVFTHPVFLQVMALLSFGPLSPSLCATLLSQFLVLQEDLRNRYLLII